MLKCKYSLGNLVIGGAIDNNLIYNLARYEQIVRLDLMKPEPVQTG